MLNGLEFGDEPAELFPLFGILKRRFISALRHADRKRRDRNPTAVEDAQTIHKTLAALADELRGREPAIAEDDLAGRRAAHPEFVFFLSGPETGGVFFEHKR